MIIVLWKIVKRYLYSFLFENEAKACKEKHAVVKTNR